MIVNVLIKSKHYIVVVNLFKNQFVRFYSAVNASLSYCLYRLDTRVSTASRLDEKAVIAYYLIVSQRVLALWILQSVAVCDVAKAKE